MKRLLIAVASLSLIASPAIAGEGHHGVSVRDLLIGGLLGAVIVDAAKDNQSYKYDSYNYTPSYNTNPCYYTPSYNLERYNPERAEYERGRAARLCQEQEERKRRAFECGYYGTCR